MRGNTGLIFLFQEDYFKEKRQGNNMWRLACQYLYIAFVFAKEESNWVPYVYSKPINISETIIHIEQPLLKATDSAIFYNNMVGQNMKMTGSAYNWHCQEL